MKNYLPGWKLNSSGPRTRSQLDDGLTSLVKRSGVQYLEVLKSKHRHRAPTFETAASSSLPSAPGSASELQWPSKASDLLRLH